MNTQQFLLSAWKWHPTALIGCAAIIALYATAWRTRLNGARTACPRDVQTNTIRGQGRPRSEPCAGPSLKQVSLLTLALGIFLLTLVSPLDALADGYLFSAHMLQHLLLLLVVPPLLLMAWPRRNNAFPLTPALSLGEREHSSSTVGAIPSASTEHQDSQMVLPLPQGEERGEGEGSVLKSATSMHPLSTPPTRSKGFRFLCSWLVGVGAMWFWHVPALCDAATSYSSVRTVQIISLLALGTLFWQPILAPQASRRLPALPGVLYLFTACFGCTLLGIIVTFAPVSVCPVYTHPMDHAGLLPMIRNGWGLTPAVDQQIGGLMMWVPACLIYLCAILGLLGRWYAAGEPATKKPSTTTPQPETSNSPEPHPPIVDHPLAPNIKPNASHA